MYTIEVDYTTGGSFSSSRQTEEIGLIFSTKELARDALVVIKEHRDLYKEESSYSFKRDRSYDEINKDGNARLWCVEACNSYLEEYGEKPSGSDNWRYHVAVLVTQKEYRNLAVSMWTGYFETLHSAKIICVGTDEDCIEF